MNKLDYRMIYLIFNFRLFSSAISSHANANFRSFFLQLKSQLEPNPHKARSFILSSTPLKIEANQ